MGQRRYTRNQKEKPNDSQKKIYPKEPVKDINTRVTRSEKRKNCTEVQLPCQERKKCKSSTTEAAEVKDKLNLKCCIST